MVLVVVLLLVMMMVVMVVMEPKFLGGEEARLGQEVLCPSDEEEVPVAAEEDHTARDTPSKSKGTGKATIDFKTVVA